MSVTTKQAKLNGVHHLAISTGCMKEQLEFFTQTLGLELAALYWMHGVDNTFHGFVKLNDSCYLAFVQSPEVAAIKREIGKSHAANPVSPSAGGTMQHLAFNVDTEEQLLTMRDRIRSHGINVYGYMDHGFCKSIYFAGPENLLLEVSTSESKAINPQAWIDPEVVSLLGINADELQRYKQPAPYVRPAKPVAQPPDDPRKPHMSMSPEVRAFMADPSDEQLLEISKTFSDPPVRLPA